MEQFVTGFLIALAAFVPISIFFLRKKAKAINTDKSGRLKELEGLGKLIGELAHEIKNPLSTIKVNLKLTAEYLSRTDFAEAGKSNQEKNKQCSARALRKIAVIQKEADRLEQVLESFLRYVDRIEPTLARSDVNSLVSDMVDFYSPQCHNNAITVRLGLCEKPLVCKIDTDMLKQAVLNLFINAQQAMAEGGELIIRTFKQENDAVIVISDTGIGITKEKLDSIFEPYYSSRPGGSGLGLPTAKRIIEAHGGTIKVDSEPEKGTSFTIKLSMCND